MFHYFHQCYGSQLYSETYGVLHSPPLRNIRPGMLATSSRVQQMHLYTYTHLDTDLVFLHFCTLELFPFHLEQIWVPWSHHLFSASQVIYSTC